MKRNRFLITAFMAAMTVTMQAQTVTEKVTVLHKSRVLWMPYSEPITDSTTGLSTVKWRNTENKHVSGRDDQWAPSVITVSSPLCSESLGIITNMNNQAIAPQTWVLTEEAGETVLHCYMKMPSDIVTNFWLASEETAIVDRETSTEHAAPIPTAGNSTSSSVPRKTTSSTSASTSRRCPSRRPTSTSMVCPTGD